MNTIQYGNITTQVDMAKYIKGATPQTQELDVVQEQPVALETGFESKATSSYDELKAALVNAKVPVTDENIKTAGLMMKSGIEVQKENIEAANGIKKQLEYIVNHISQEAVDSITKDSISLDKITMDILEDIIADVSTGSKDTVKEVSEKEVKIATDKYISENDLELKLSETQLQVLTLCVKNLMIQDLPITNKNVQALVSAVDKSYEVKGTDENIAITLIKKNAATTLENSYVAKYSSNKYSDHATKPISDEDFNALLPQIEKLIKAEGLEDKNAAIQAARVLVENELPVTAENIVKIMDINTMQLEGLDIEKIAYEAAKNIKNDKEPTDITLYKISGQVENNYSNTEKLDLEVTTKKYQNIIKSLPHYDDETIKQAIEGSETLTLKDLQIAYEQIKQQLLQKDQKTDDTKNKEVVAENTAQLQIDVEKELKTVTAKRQVAEIRLRLTSESMATLLDKGIEIDTLGLKEAIEELKAIEAELYKSSLNRAGALSSAENIAQMDDLYQKLESIKTLTPATYSQVIQANIPFTIDALAESEEINLQQLQLQQATSSYEAAQTQPNTRFGDNFSKVVDQLEPLVTDLGLEATEENIRATKILVKNNMEVTKENIEAIKLIDIKVDTVTTQLHPTIAANMIKDGFNIVETTIDDVLKYMDSFKELLGEDLKDKIASYIYDMDKTGELTGSQRETMIGIYRMLHTVEKTEGRATGFLLKNDMPLTLGNLMEAANYYDRTRAKQSDIDVNIDDAFGALEALIVPDKSIKAQLNAAQGLAQEKQTTQSTQVTQENLINSQAELNESDYEQNIVNKFIEKAQPDLISKMIKQYPDLESMPIENILKAMEQVQEQNTEYTQSLENKATNKTQEFINTLNKLASVEPTTVLWMKNNTIPLTVSNIEVMQNFMKDAFWFGDQISDFSKSVKEQLGQEESLNSVIAKSDLSGLKEGKSATEVLEELEQEISKVKKDAIDLPEQQRQGLWKQADNLEKAIQLQKQVQKDETLYQIPIQLHGGLTNMNLYVMNDKEGSGKLSERDMKVFVAMKTETLGTVQIYMKLTDKNIDFQINTDQPEATRFLQANKASLQANIEELGYMVSKMNYGEEKKKSPLQTQIQPKIKTSRENALSDGFEVVV